MPWFKKFAKRLLCAAQDKGMGETRVSDDMNTFMFTCLPLPGTMLSPSPPTPHLTTPHEAGVAYYCYLTDEETEEVRAGIPESRLVCL